MQEVPAPEDMSDMTTAGNILMIASDASVKSILESIRAIHTKLCQDSVNKAAKIAAILCPESFPERVVKVSISSCKFGEYNATRLGRSVLVHLHVLLRNCSHHQS